MQRLSIFLAVIALIIAACGSDAETTTTSAETPTTTAAPADTTSAPTPSGEGHQLVIASVDFDRGVIVITNTGDDDYDLSGHQLCNRPTYVALPEQTLAAGESVEVPTDSLGLGPDDGELGLYDARDFGNPDAMLRYVQWGSGDHGRAGTAAAAGVWTAASEFVAGGSALLFTSAANPISPDDWSAG